MAVAVSRDLIELLQRIPLSLGQLTSSGSWQADFPLPHGIVNTEFLNEILPPWASSFFASQICKQLLSSVDK
jgi:hypothetical protein